MLIASKFHEIIGLWFENMVGVRFVVGVGVGVGIGVGVGVRVTVRVRVRIRIKVRVSVSALTPELILRGSF